MQFVAKIEVIVAALITKKEDVHFGRHPVGRYKKGRVEALCRVRIGRM